MENLELYSEIENYLQGKLSAEKIAAFEKKLLEDSEFTEEVRLYQTMRLAIDTVSKDQLKKELMNFGETMSRNEPASLKIITYWTKPQFYGAIAASVLLLVIFSGIFFTSKRYNSEDLYAKYMDTPHLVGGYRGADDIDSLMRLVYVSFNSKDYSKAKVYFNKILESDPTNGTANFFLGIIELKFGNPTAARTFFEKVPSYNDYYPHSSWYTALSFLKERNLGEAKEVLEDISKQDTHYKKEEADELRGLLEEVFE